MTAKANYIAIWTDGMGTYQAKCMDCSWTSKWTRSESKAKSEAKAHGQTHVCRCEAGSDKLCTACQMHETRGANSWRENR